MLLRQMGQVQYRAQVLLNQASGLATDAKANDPKWIDVDDVFSSANSAVQYIHAKYPGRQDLRVSAVGVGAGAEPQFHICVLCSGGDEHPSSWVTTRDTYTANAAARLVSAKYKTWDGVYLAQVRGPFGLCTMWPIRMSPDWWEELPHRPND